jgi:hypothetical protein
MPDPRRIPSGSTVGGRMPRGMTGVTLLSVTGGEECRRGPGRTQLSIPTKKLGCRGFPVTALP